MRFRQITNRGNVERGTRGEMKGIKNIFKNQELGWRRIETQSAEVWRQRGNRSSEGGIVRKSEGYGLMD